VSVKTVKKLSFWFEKNARDLPWRRSPDPYRVWLSEVMLQQTRVATVIPYFERFLQEFPEITDLARAPEEQVFRLWAGLGYYSRARNLHRGAKAIAERLKNHQGFPSNREEWLAVPGVGPYTAGAICSIALNQREPIVDGNVVRVLSRLHAIAELDSAHTLIWEHARALVNARGADPRTVNQALMELGATLCKPKNPECSRCPVATLCLGKDHPETYPPRKPKKEWKQVRESRVVLLRGPAEIPEVLLLKNPEGAWREGLWDFPADASGVRSDRMALLQEFEIRYVVTRHRVERQHRVFRLAGPGKSPSGDSLRWFPLDSLPGVPAPVKKALRRVFPDPKRC
jgi:A/G-specific adenine glycosylase